MTLRPDSSDLPATRQTSAPQDKPLVMMIGGPTASGKSALAAAVAAEWNGTVINADSMQVYRELPVLAEQGLVRLGKPGQDRDVVHRVQSQADDVAGRLGGRRPGGWPGG